jgi:hypothetical protein
MLRFLQPNSIDFRGEFREIAVGFSIRSWYDGEPMFGKVAEWSIASDLKSDEAQASVSSNLTLSV